MQKSNGQAVGVTGGFYINEHGYSANILNNRDIVTGGFEQSRSDYSNEKVRAYRFSKNPKKFYAFGPNGLLNIAYKF